MSQELKALIREVVKQARITAAILNNSVTIHDPETVAIGLNQTLRALDDYLDKRN